MVILAIQYFLGSHGYHIQDIDTGCKVFKYYDNEAHGYNNHVMADRTVIFLITKGEREMAKMAKMIKMADLIYNISD